MSTIGGTPPTNPAEAPDTSPQRVRRRTVAIHDLLHEPIQQRRSEPTESSNVPSRSKQMKRGRGRHELDDRTWLGLTERVVHSWPIPIRLVLLMGVLLTGTTEEAAAVGMAAQLLLALLSLLGRRRRQRLRAA